MKVGEQETVTDVMEGGTLAVTWAEPDLVESSVEVAVIVAVPAEAGVKIPAELTLPMPDGLTDQVTDELKLPVPVTVEVQAEVWFVRMDVGEQETVTDVMEGGTLAVTWAEPDLDVSSVDVAVMVAVPAEEGVNIPAELTLPTLEGLTDQVTVEL